MDWEIYHIIERAEIIYNEEEDEATLSCFVPASGEHFGKLLDGATQATLAFSGGVVEGRSLIAFGLRNANGEFFLALEKKDWPLLMEMPDQLLFQYGEGEKEQFETTFLNWMFEQFIDEAIDQYNEGAKNPFTIDIVEVFADEDEA